MSSVNFAEGIGATLGFSTTSATINLKDINFSGITRTDIPTHTQSTTGLKTYVPSTLADGGTLTITFDMNLEDHAALYIAATSTPNETVTVTLPKSNPGNSIAASLAFSGYINNYVPGNVIPEQLIDGQLTIKIADDITATNESA